MTRRVPILVTLALLLLAMPALAQNTGSADFTRYVALGDSLTAGFTSGSLYGPVQQVSYPAQIFDVVNGTFAGFEQPIVSSPGIPAIQQLQSLVPTVVGSVGGSGQPTNLFLQRPYDNLAVPGATVSDVLRTVSDGGLHDVVLRGLGTQLQQAQSLQPTFATLWIGNNDVLGAAISGLVIEGITVTPVAQFEADYRQIVGGLGAVGAQLALGTIPDVTIIPYVTTIAPVLVDPNTNQPILVNGQTVPLIGPNGPLVPGQDFVLLVEGPRQLANGRGIPVALGGTGQPLTDEAVLTSNEVAFLRDRVAAYNNIIRTIAGEAGAAVAETGAILGEINAEGLDLGGITFTTEFLTGGLFSYDGVHPTPLGYAISGDIFIEAINDHYGADIPLINLGPFVYGSLGSLGTGVTFGAGMPRTTPRADRNLYASLGLPDRPTLRQLASASSDDGGGDPPPPPPPNPGGESNDDGDDGAIDPPPPPPPPPSVCSVLPGHPDYCALCGPCGIGEGGCAPNTCGPGLTCSEVPGPMANDRLVCLPN
ncbi:MAG: SGNH/GDSL hydrolase family protein [Acidobacteriota bacterium]